MDKTKLLFSKIVEDLNSDKLSEIVISSSKSFKNLVMAELETMPIIACKKPIYISYNRIAEIYKKSN